MGRFRLGIDIGGTFTDFALQNAETGELAVWKHLSTPSDPSRAAVKGAAELLEAQGVAFEDLEQIIHATTIGANIIVEGKGARTALLVTEGFGDILVISRQLRHSPYDITSRKHAPLVPRDLVYEVPERLAYDGSVHRPLDEARVREIGRTLRERGVETVAVSFLHAYASADHERRVREILGEECPDVAVSLSSDVAPVVREYERTSTTVANAYIRPAFQEYLGRMQAALADQGFRGQLYLMQANGGITSAQETAELPIRAVEAGPAAGVTMAAANGALAGIEDILAFDMGGTTAKACVIKGGKPSMLTLFEIDQTLMRPGTGLPLLIPSVDLIEIGAGGGSLAHTALGIVEVGPQSAGADPGPAAYGLGGDHATVTDANVVLGYLNPDFFNGGRMSLDVERARRAITADVADRLGLSVERAAWGIHEAVTNNMQHALRAVSIERAHDPRQLTMVSFGGAASMHATRLARELGMARVIVPAFAGVGSAVGLLNADPRFDLMQSWIGPADDEHRPQIEAAFAELEQRGNALLDGSGLDGERSIVRSVDMRHRGQGNVLEITVGGGEALVPELLASFRDRYATLYGYADGDAHAEITAIRLSAGTEAPKIDLPSGQESAGEPTPNSTRSAYFPEADGYVDCPCYRRDELGVGLELTGPAIVEERESCTVLLPGDRASIDRYGNLVIQIGV